MKLSPEEAKRRELLTKLHPSVLAVIERLQRKESQLTTDEMKFVRDGKAEVQIWLIDKSAESLAELKKLGFEIILDPKTAKLVIGRLPIENLQKIGGVEISSLCSATKELIEFCTEGGNLCARCLGLTLPRLYASTWLAGWLNCQSVISWAPALTFV